MDPTTIGAIGLVVLLIFLLMGLHVGLTLAFVGGTGIVVLLGLKGGANLLGSAPFATAAAYDLSPLPLFLLMGAFAANGGLGEKAYQAMSKWLGKLPGGLAIATTFGNALFGMACGSSLAATAVFTKVALPEMLKRNYSKELAIGSIAASGTFSTMIPPSGLLILYAIFTGESIGRLFLAGFIPGFITALTYAALIFMRVRRHPYLAPAASKSCDASTRGFSMFSIWQIILLSGLVLGGLFLGWFTPTEAGGIGAFGAFLIAIINKKFHGARIIETLVDCMRINGMIFLIIIGAIVFGRFLSVTQIPGNLTTVLTELPISRHAILIVLIFMYFVLGMFLESIAIFCITLPIVFPAILDLGFDPIWFAIVLIKTCEIGLVTPPVGMNVYVACTTAKGLVSLEETFKGITPFIICDLFVLALLIVLPQIALLLPNLVYAK